MSYRGILTGDAHALATAWMVTLGAVGGGIVLGRDVEVPGDHAAGLAAALATTGVDVADLGVAGIDEVAYVCNVLGMPGVHLGQDEATGLRPGASPLNLSAATSSALVRTAATPGVVSADDLTDDYVAHLRSRAPLHGIHAVQVWLQASGTAAATAPLALADSAICPVDSPDEADVQLFVDGARNSLVVRDERGRLVRAADIAVLLAHHGLTGRTSLFGVPSPLLLARTILGILGNSTEPLSGLVADAEADRDTLTLPITRFDEAARAVDAAFARLAPQRRGGTGLHLSGQAGRLGAWALSLRRQPGQGGAMLVVQAADAHLRAALRDDARSILVQFAPAA